MSTHPFPDWRHSLRRAVLAAALVPASAAAQAPLPPDTVTTALDGDTIPRLGAVGGVAVDAAGFVYFADFRDRLWRYLPGKTIELVAEGLYGASGLAVGPRGEIYQSSFFGNSISRIARDGRITAFATSGLSGPVGIAVGGGGELYVCNCSNSTISRVDTTGRATPFAAGALFACPNGIAIDDRGDLFVANYSNTTVVKITPDGTASVHADLPGGGGNTHIAFGNGGLYVTKYRSHQVFRVERDGTARLVAGTGARGADDGPALAARLSQPNGIAVGPNGRDLWFNELVSGEALFGGDARARLRRIRLVGLREVLAAAEPTAAAVEEAYRRYRAARPAEDVSGAAVTAGYEYLTARQVGPALALFRANAADRPRDAGSQFHYGEALRFTGRPDEARRQYERALAIDSTHAQARARLGRTAARPPAGP